MPLQLSGQVGPGVSGDGATPPLRQGKSNELLFSEVHGRYTESAYRQNLFVAQGNVVAMVAYTTAAGTGGPLLWNNTTNKVASILAVGWGLTVAATAAGAIGLTGNTNQTTAPTTTTAIDGVRNCYLGGAAPAMTTYRIGTVANAGNFFLPVGDVNTGALTVQSGHLNWVDVGGLLIVPPNCWAAVSASGTLTSSTVTTGLVWEELPL